MKPIVLCGPTASGKTELALELARQTDGIILSADSRQVYKRLTVGTAKPAGTWQNGAYRVDGVPYHLVDFLDVTDTFNAGAFKARAGEIIQNNPGRQIIFAGGTGMYLHAFFVGMDELPQSTQETRETLQKLLAERGKEGLHNALKEKDPASAAAIPAGNVQRTMRALELCLLTGKPASELKSGNFFKLPDENASQWVYLDWAKEALHARINLRTDQIFDGMAEEARTLLTEGYAEDTPALKSLGYPQAIAFLKGELARKDAVDRVATLTRQYAKRQRTWFNRYTNALRVTLTHPTDFDAKKIARDILSRASN
ncbi:MAG: tRNA (adenosine(37)-N6)-dimethylallyltransferase MiaA [Candidatus Avelusimicrobium sp.]|uniref:tRNA (adenosine(37)-N6)-dimethylallyltransferase MiaA n=1 Tax=Candidatus Avelusimicrobium sp. TaxID=3048833 RepID=UPI003F0C1D8F